MREANSNNITIELRGVEVRADACIMVEIQNEEITEVRDG